MRLTHFFIFFLFSLGTLAGCSWKDMEAWRGDAVWSDDDTSVVGIYEYFEGQSTITHTKKRSVESEIYLMPFGAHAGNPRLLMTRSPGRVNHLFFMRSAGYLIVSREDRIEEQDEGMNQMSHFYLDKIGLNGVRTALGSRRALTMISCDPEGQSATTTGQVLTAYPSPDGRIIARVDSASDCELQSATITFLAADTLAAIGDPFIVSQPSRESLGLTNYAWLENGRFARMQMTALGPAGSSYAPNTEPESIADLSYDCLFPPTTSSDMNEAGEYVGLSDGVVQVSPPDPAALTFGCPE